MAKDIFDKLGQNAVLVSGHGVNLRVARRLADSLIRFNKKRAGESEEQLGITCPLYANQCERIMGALPSVVRGREERYCRGNHTQCEYNQNGGHAPNQ